MRSFMYKILKIIHKFAKCGKAEFSVAPATKATRAARRMCWGWYLRTCPYFLIFFIYFYVLSCAGGGYKLQKHLDWIMAHAYCIQKLYHYGNVMIIKKHKNHKSIHKL